jgi:hypothetical protein
LTSTPTPDRSEGSFVDIEIEVETLPVKARTGPGR